jgi:hypothetical protein
MPCGHRRSSLSGASRSIEDDTILLSFIFDLGVTALKPLIRAASAAAIAAFIPLSSQVPILAQSAISEPSPAHVVRVNRCDPQRTVSTSTTYAGYSRAYYPGRAYVWNDPYGHRYNQAAIVSTNGTLYLDYMNVTHEVMKTIEFGLVANGHLVAQVRDVGTFSPGAEIKHQFGLNENVFPLQTALARCVALRITYAGGASWRNPHLPAIQHAIYGEH